MDLFESQIASPPLLSMVIHVSSVPWYVKSVIIIIVSLSGQLNLCVWSTSVMSVRTCLRTWLWHLEMQLYCIVCGRWKGPMAAGDVQQTIMIHYEWPNSSHCTCAHACCVCVCACLCALCVLSVLNWPMYCLNLESYNIWQSTPGTVPVAPSTKTLLDETEIPICHLRVYLW